MATTIVSGNDTAGLTLTAASSVTVTSTGTVAGSVLDRFNGNSFYDAIFANSSAPLYLSNAGSIIAPSNKTALGTFANAVDMHAGGTIVNQQGGLIEGMAHGYAIFDNSSTTSVVAIQNAGTISSSNHAIAIEDSGTVNLTNSSTGIILGASDALFLQLDQSETVLNAGKITGTGLAAYLSTANNFYMTNASTGTVSGATGGLVIDGMSSQSTSALVNAGSVGGGSGVGVNIDIGASSVLLNKAGGTISGGSQGVYIFANDANAVDSVSNAGVITGTVGLMFQKYGYVLTEIVTNAGTITGTGGTAVSGGNGGLHLNVVAGAVFNGDVIASASLSTYTSSGYIYNPNKLNALELNSSASAGTIIGIGTSFQNFTTIEIDAGATWSVAGDVQGLASGETIIGFSSLDTLELTGFAATSEHFANNALTLSNGSTSEIITLVEPGASSADFTLATSGGNSFITTDIACFYPGTRIATPDGARAVEELAAGEMVLTQNGPAPLRWVAQSKISLRFADKLRAMPVRIRAGALGDGLPALDLLVSPDHALFIQDVLVQAGALVGLAGIERAEEVPQVFTYYHLELETHGLLLAEGVWAETFLDEAGWGAFANQEDRPAREAPMQELPYPRVKSARQLPAGLRAMLQRRAAA